MKDPFCTPRNLATQSCRNNGQMLITTPSDAVRWALSSLCKQLFLVEEAVFFHLDDWIFSM